MLACNSALQAIFQIQLESVKSATIHVNSALNLAIINVQAVFQASIILMESAYKNVRMDITNINYE